MPGGEAARREEGIVVPEARDDCRGVIPGDSFRGEEEEEEERG